MNKWLRRFIWNSVSNYRLSRADQIIEERRQLENEISWAKLEMSGADFDVKRQTIYREQMKQYLAVLEEKLDLLEIEAQPEKVSATTQSEILLGDRVA